jgi:sec-independent protein translocase protein TatA
MFGISAEHLLILGIVLLIFGPRRLPELGNTLGKAIRNFKDSISGVEEASFRKLGEQNTPTSNERLQAPPVQVAPPVQPSATAQSPAVPTNKDSSEAVQVGESRPSASQTQI